MLGLGLIVGGAVFAFAFSDIGGQYASMQSFMRGFLFCLLSLASGLIFILYRFFRVGRAQSTSKTSVIGKAPHLLPRDAVRATEESCEWVNEFIAQAVTIVDLCDVRDAILNACASTNVLQNVHVLDLSWGGKPPRVIENLRAWHQVSSDGTGNMVLCVETNIVLKSPARVSISADVVVNSPVPSALALPVKLTISNIELTGKLRASVSLAQQTAFVSFDSAPHVDFSLATEFGVDGTLSDAPKIKKLLRAGLVHIIVSKLVAPNGHTLNWGTKSK